MKKFPNSFCGPQKKIQNKPTDHALPLGSNEVVTTSAWRVQPIYWGQASSRKQSECGTHGLSNILKLQATFFFSIYHRRAGTANLFHMRGGRVHAFNTQCTFKLAIDIEPCCDY